MFNEKYSNGGSSENKLQSVFFQHTHTHTHIYIYIYIYIYKHLHIHLALIFLSGYPSKYSKIISVRV